MYVYSFVAWNQKCCSIRMIFAIIFLSFLCPTPNSMVCLFVVFHSHCCFTTKQQFLGQQQILKPYSFYIYHTQPLSSVHQDWVKDSPSNPILHHDGFANFQGLFEPDTRALANELRARVREKACHLCIFQMYSGTSNTGTFWPVTLFCWPRVPTAVGTATYRGTVCALHKGIQPVGQKGAKIRPVFCLPSHVPRGLHHPEGVPLSDLHKGSL